MDRITGGEVHRFLSGRESISQGPKSGEHREYQGNLIRMAFQEPGRELEKKPRVHLG